MTNFEVVVLKFFELAFVTCYYCDPYRDLQHTVTYKLGPVYQQNSKHCKFMSNKTTGKTKTRTSTTGQQHKKKQQLRILRTTKLVAITQMSGRNRGMEQLPQNGTLRKSMPQQNRKHKKTKNQLPQNNIRQRR